MIREIPDWAAELEDELEEVIKEKLVEKRGIQQKFVDDSKNLEGAVRDIRIVAERLDENRTKRRNWDIEDELG